METTAGPVIGSLDPAWCRRRPGSLRPAPARRLPGRAWRIEIAIERRVLRRPASGVPRRRAGRRKAADPDTWPVYGAEPANVLERLQEARADEEAVSLSPRQVAEVLGPPQDLPGRAPEVLPGILWEWTKTTTPPEGKPPSSRTSAALPGRSTRCR